VHQILEKKVDGVYSLGKKKYKKTKKTKKVDGTSNLKKKLSVHLV